ncbi:tRNA-5-methyluridine(54) 2-sulfurtransferase [Nanobdella aerobiophila]|uniref:tRNA-5-methyluridine(54) 2-sulfurtransferase n=1 Tax=Nanobdella aerobiophila TaxID=2586965 RepID=A0A915SAC2_9ARCH|nr:adenine nucleotide alpha hydrolase family protein [Nanobdella aerobiophila]BBL45652.1 tRNA-5-methyluridine(54) 2-sulfurtransferase [Nanobdella aerobiophila]
MKCSFCNNNAIYRYKDLYYCKDHFIKYFEEKTIKTIEKYSLIKEGDIIGVGVSGGKDSNALLYFLNKYTEYFNIKVYGVHIDEGIKGYRDKDTLKLLEIARLYNIEIKIYKFEDYFNTRLEDALKISRDMKSCTICGVWRRWLMWKASKDLDINKFATAHNLNDELQTIIMNIFEDNIKDLLKTGPYTGIIETDFIPRIKPFYFNSEKENYIYSIINNLAPIYGECSFINGEFREYIRSKLYNIENIYEGFHEELLKNILEIINNAKVDFKNMNNIKLNKCKICGYPTTREICRACEIRLELKNG